MILVTFTLMLFTKIKHFWFGITPSLIWNFHTIANFPHTYWMAPETRWSIKKWITLNDQDDQYQWKRWSIKKWIIAISKPFQIQPLPLSHLLFYSNNAYEAWVALGVHDSDEKVVFSSLPFPAPDIPFPTAVIALIIQLQRCKNLSVVMQCFFLRNEGKVYNTLIFKLHTHFGWHPHRFC